MRHPCYALLAVLVVALCASPAAAADGPRADSGVRSSPLPAAMDGPVAQDIPRDACCHQSRSGGRARTPASRFGPRGKLLSAISFGEVTCTAELGTVLTTGRSPLL